jgi:DNA (cytosine-5)-methyltransferase 1
MGYHRAGFEVVGVDIEPMKDYPFEFHQGDALEYLESHGHEFDVIHASPPCQAYSEMQRIWKNDTEHPDLIVPTRDLLLVSRKPYVIENVIGAPMRDDLLLCGTMFGLRIIRHRIFESNIPLPVLMPPCDHSDVYDPWHGLPGVRSADKFRKAMGIDWMRSSGGGRRKGTLALAIPPAYTEFIGRELMRQLVTA